MRTLILDAIKNRTNSIKIAADFLKNGEVIVFPTETVYGLGCAIFNLASVEKVYELKGRNKTNPLAAHISDLSHTEFLCQSIPDDFYKLADKFLPGPLSIVLKKHNSISDIVTGNLNTISIRMPDNEICLELINAVGQPLAATSANFSGKPAATKPDFVLNDFDSKIVAILNGGNCRYNIESTVLSLTEHRPTLIRPGAISQQDIEKVLGKKVYSADRSLSLYNPLSNIKKSKLKVRLFLDEDSILKYLDKNKSMKILVLGNFNQEINSNVCIELKQETFFENLRYAEIGNFDEILILFDDIIKQNQALAFRINNLTNQ